MKYLWSKFPYFFQTSLKSLRLRKRLHWIVNAFLCLSLLVFAWTYLWTCWALPGPLLGLARPYWPFLAFGDWLMCIHYNLLGCFCSQLHLNWVSSVENDENDGWFWGSLLIKQSISEGFADKCPFGYPNNLLTPLLWVPFPPSFLQSLQSKKVYLVWNVVIKYKKSVC